MAPSGPSSPPDGGSTRRRSLAASNAGVLPPDVLFDVLLRLPAKELCRLRAVCRAWRSLTVDPLFTGAHAARHPDPLFLANFRDDQTHVCVVDLSGNVLKWIPTDGHRLLPTRLDLTCVTTVRNRCHVLDPATGNVHVLPESPAAEHLDRENLLKPYTSFVFGRIPTTAEYKVLRIFNRPDFAGFNQCQLFEVFTINGPSDSDSGYAQWRSMRQRHSYDYFVETSSGVSIGEVVYFKVDTVYDAMISGGVNPGISPDCIIAFDLASEEWMAHLHGPISGIFQTVEYDDDLDDYRALWSHITLADLSGSLVLVHYRNCRDIMDLWLLKDFDNSSWVKEYIIQIEPIFPSIEWWVKSLFMLDDGRLLIHFKVTGLLFIYDPRTKTSAQVEMRHLDTVAMYTGNLLSL